MILGNAAELAYWIFQRELAKEGKATDPIINTYRFCNVRREDDRVTRWLKKHWRDPYSKHPNLTVAMLLARMINWPPTLEYLGFPEEWNAEIIVKRMNTMQQPAKIWTSAYVITTCGKPMDKALYVVGTVCNAVYLRGIRPHPGDSLEAFWTNLCRTDGLGAGFIAAQVIADLKNIPDNPLAQARDWWTWAVPGPGSRRGMRRYFNESIKLPIHAKGWTEGLRVVIEETQPLVEKHVGRIHAQDWQNILCEYDKWKRVKHGEGRPRQRYHPETAYQV